MGNYIKPADRLAGETLNGGWVVVSPYTHPHVIHSSCYIVNKGNQKGFLKAFDYSDLKKAGGKDQFKRLSLKFERELSMLKKCSDKDIKTVIQLLTHDSHFFDPGGVDNRVDYFIIEFSDDGSVHDCLTNTNLLAFENKFQALIYIFDGLNDLHLNGIMHLDLKIENLVYFIQERLTKITDFGSARQLIIESDEDLLNDLNSISTTRQYAPPECLYIENWTPDWNEYRRKIDLYLVGNVIVKLFTNVSFTALLRNKIPKSYDWDNNQNNGKLKQYLPHLVNAAGDVYLEIEAKLNVINAECGMPLDNKNIEDLMKIIAELCSPDAQERGHPKELARKNGTDGLYRYNKKNFGKKKQRKTLKMQMLGSIIIELIEMHT